NSANVLTWQELRDAAPTLGVELISLEVRDVQEFYRAFEFATTQGADALFVAPDPMIGVDGRPQLIEFATKHRLPAISADQTPAQGGLPMAYGPTFPAQFHRAAYYVDRILKGARPADLPVEQPTTFDLVINLKTAQVLDLTIPQDVLLQATEVLQ